MIRLSLLCLELVVSRPAVGRYQTSLIKLSRISPLIAAKVTAKTNIVGLQSRKEPNRIDSFPTKFIRTNKILSKIR